MDMIEQIIQLALFEDTCLGDLTTESIFLDPQEKTALIVAKQSFILAGTDVAKKVFHAVDPSITCKNHFNDSDTIKTDDVILSITGDIRSLLKAERVALNFLQRLSGIATLTRQFVNALDNPTVRLVDTRKTTPGWRKIEKDAVRAGGGFNHRFALYDGILIKDNHIRAAGSIAAAVSRVRAKASHLMKVEVEVSDMTQVQQALDARADVIMLDNMDIDTMTNAVALIGKRAVVEASGNVSLQTLNAISGTGVDVISCGALTHQSVSVDLSMRIAADSDHGS
ncbi:MAG: nicotinate-nucleotide diphosphorylase (carboxylating) [Desulfobacter postgatei]|uniref:Probable nicotinate-nucleotide pyrophosphorylase [carboxylating] n=1 Tax=Desulfobacter postgatei TaxID=2293 RepID=A0A2G6MPY7_9BACT|nr:MAG: nicotinate-nucleotide diphosphorylase (carboxylating) [Desulfobacter postgatei]